MCVLIVSDNYFEGGNNILMFITGEIIYLMFIVCQVFNNLIDIFILNRIEIELENKATFQVFFRYNFLIKY